MGNIAEWVYLAEGAKIVGDVSIGEGSSVWYNAVIRGDANPIVIGENTNVQGKLIPEGSLCFGNPAKVVREITKEEKKSILENANEYSDEASKQLREEV